MTIKSGTTFSMDSLVLIPGADLGLASNTITETPIPVIFNPTPSITRVYYLSNPVNFTGTIQLYYQPSELNSNAENTLLLTDSTVGGNWNSESTSTVNMTFHYVQMLAAGHSFNAATASGTIIPLPLTLISFSGAWSGDEVGLEWVVAQMDEQVNFTVESSVDGSSWTDIGEVAGVQGNGEFTYHFVDKNPLSTSLYYRIKIIQLSGQYTYSNIINLDKASGGNEVRLLVGNNTLSVLFSGTGPSALRLINTLGMVVYVDHNTRREYDLGGLMPGAYFLQFQIDGQWNVRKILLR